MKPWDRTFYAERMREERFAYSEEELRPYFSLPRVLDGLFKLAHRLFDIEIAPAPEQPPVWDEAVVLYGARFWSGICTRGCHWFPRLLSLEAIMRVINNSLPCRDHGFSTNPRPLSCV
jgi:hypothetical protein